MSRLGVAEENIGMNSAAEVKLVRFEALDLKDGVGRVLEVLVFEEGASEGGKFGCSMTSVRKTMVMFVRMEEEDEQRRTRVGVRQ